MQVDVGIIGLGVMGKNIGLNLAGKGYAVMGYDVSRDAVERFACAGEANEVSIHGALSIRELIDSLKLPRRILIMVKAGCLVDSVIHELRPHLDKGDIIMDGGNSHYHDTARRIREAEAEGLLYLGIGVSGGEEGALKGPSLMPGGPREAWSQVETMFKTIAAHTDEGEACCDYIGPGGAGHFVKMVHNGIEYVDMQLIAETYSLLKDAMGLSPGQAGAVFEQWNRGELGSYLIEITACILRKTHRDTGMPMVDIIADNAGHKGTGKWTAQAALDLGVPAPAMAEAVFARYLSALKDERLMARERYGASSMESKPSGERLSIEDLRQSLYAAKICAYAQGFALMRAASEEYQWCLNLGAIAQVWRAGCIIRARFLDIIAQAYRHDAGLPNLLLAPFFRDSILSAEAAWRGTAKSAIGSGIAIPALCSCLAYYDSYRTERLPSNLIQAQRDYFGAHTYERVDRPGHFHTHWLEDSDTVGSDMVGPPVKD